MWVRTVQRNEVDVSPSENAATHRLTRAFGVAVAAVAELLFTAGVAVEL